MLVKQDSTLYTYPVHEESRIEQSIPHQYRLCQKHDGNLVLQGAFQWSQGFLGGIEWRDLPTVKEE